MRFGTFAISLLAGSGYFPAIGQAGIVALYETATTCFPGTPVSGTTSTSSAARIASTPSSTVWNDANIAAGENFILEVQRIDGSDLTTRQQPVSQASWLMDNGNTTTDPTRAAIHFIDNLNRLHVNSYTMSVNDGIPSAPFVATAGVSTINTAFSTTNTKLYWNSTFFSNQTAQFYKLPVGVLENAQILGKYYGPPEPNRGWTPIALWARPLNMPQGPPSPAPGTGPSVSASSRKLTSSLSSIGIPTPSNVSPDGNCGPANGFSCQGSTFGVCCSSDGRCSSTDHACQAGCQPNFGFCAPAGANISENGLCGQQNHKICLGSQFGNCCSIYGYCGSTDEFCAPRNCATGFGYCSPEKPSASSSSGTETSSSETALPFVTVPKTPNGLTSSYTVESSASAGNLVPFPTQGVTSGATNSPTSSSGITFSSGVSFNGSSPSSSGSAVSNSIATLSIVVVSGSLSGPVPPALSSTAGVPFTNRVSASSVGVVPTSEGDLASI